MFAVAIAPLIVDTAHRDGTQNAKQAACDKQSGKLRSIQYPVRVSSACYFVDIAFLAISETAAMIPFVLHNDKQVTL
jgi:hypothetical protein